MDESNAEKVFKYIKKVNKLDIMSDIIGDLTHSEYMMMNLIKCRSKASEGIKISALASLLQISNPAVSQMINVIENKGYVERVTTKADRRIVYVRLTERGRGLIEKAQKSANKVICDIFDEMGEEDTNTLLRLLDKAYLIADEYKKSM